MPYKTLTKRTLNRLGRMRCHKIISSTDSIHSSQYIIGDIYVMILRAMIYHHLRAQYHQTKQFRDQLLHACINYNFFIDQDIYVQIIQEPSKTHHQLIF